MDVKGGIHSNSIDFNTPLTSMDGLSRQKINKEVMTLSVTLSILRKLLINKNPGMDSFIGEFYPTVKRN